ncbi:MAG: trypsin-like peptidase domain-containing protein [Planctomycetota bacterium]|nr:trypsin-like peptidase domain-containing protein [Planctomycetota bacterium]
MKTERTRRTPRWPIALLLLVGLVVTAAPALADEAAADDDIQRALAQARAVERDLVGVLDEVTRASVTVVHHARLPARLRGQGRSPLFVNGAGSGVLVSYRGTHVVTNAHVVAGASNVEIITRDGRHIPVTVRAKDESRDLAVLTLPDDVGTIPSVTLEQRATTNLREGAWVVATGNPFMLAHDGHGAATLGVFSGARAAPRKGMGSGSNYLLQHDAEINPGNSGGPLWNRRGDLLGINGAIVTRSMRLGGGPSYTGTSISVPVTQVRSFLDRVLAPPAKAPVKAAKVETPTPKRAEAPKRIARQPVARTSASRLGLRVRTSVDAQNRPDGALVIRVARTSSLRASRGRGLQSGDRITRVTRGGKQYPVRSSQDLESALSDLATTQGVSIQYVRGRRNLTWSGSLDAVRRQ